MKTTKSMRLVMAAGLLAAAVGLTGCDRQSTYNRAEQPAGERTAGEVIDDKTVTSRVKDALDADATHKYPEVKVAAFKGTVQLSGFVNQGEQKDRAAEVAKNVAGVKDVENNITVKK
jgi:hyperosmotically inducible protein